MTKKGRRSIEVKVTLTPTQHDLLLMLVREEAIVGRHDEKGRATVILKKLGEEV